MRVTFDVAMLVVAPRCLAASDADVARALDAARAQAAAGDVVAQFSLGAMLYYGGDDTAQAIEWIRKAAAQQYAPAEFQHGSDLRLRLRCRAERSPGARRGTGGPPSTAARRRSGRSAISTGKGAASPPTRPKPRAGIGVPPMVMIFARNISSVRCTSTVPA